ncbi:MAG TPA: restriction endonuclease subunit S [Chitinispirillaceae bacterium]|nr:restriction endonuclease subunit S [Chitinispirillaceae bacterium]
MNLKEYTLGEFFQIKHGYAFKGEFFSDEGTHIVVTPGNFYEEGGFRFVENKAKYYTGDIPANFILNENDLVIAMTEQAPGLLGSSAIIPVSNTFLHNQRIGLITGLKKEQLNGKFLYYLFNTTGVRHQISASATGTKVRHTAPDRVYSVKVRLPVLSVQEKVAGILSAYDDHIENNLRRIELLETSARLIYKEWFVKLNFPGREHTRIVDGVPEGWSKKTLFEIAEILSGGTPKTAVDEFWNGDIPFYTPKDSVNSVYVIDTEKHLTESGLKCCNSRFYPKNTLFITARGTVGNLNLAQQPMAMNQSCYALKGIGSISQTFLFYLVKDRVEHIKAHSGGAVFNAIIVDTFKRIDCIIPTTELIRGFDEKICPIFYQIENLLLQNSKLKQARDLLLPKLMSGEITV